MTNDDNIIIIIIVIYFMVDIIIILFFYYYVVSRMVKSMVNRKKCDRPARNSVHSTHQLSPFSLVSRRPSTPSISPFVFFSVYLRQKKFLWLFVGHWRHRRMSIDMNILVIIILIIIVIV